MITFNGSTSPPRRYLIQTDGAAEVSLKNAVGKDGAEDITFDTGVQAICVRIKKPVRTAADKNDSGYILHVSPYAGEVRKDVSVGIYDTIPGDQEWWEVSKFPIQRNRTEGLTKYNYYFAVDDTNTPGTRHWAAATLEVLIYEG